MPEKKILIIEDEFPMRYLIEHALKKAGFHIHLAKDGPDGVQRALQLQPDLIILDVMMPGMSGFDVCTQIKNDPAGSKIPIIFLSANESAHYRQKAFAVGGDEYLTKPFDGSELIAHITAVIRRQKQKQSGQLFAQQGQTLSLFSPKGGVGTSTLAIQLAEAIVIQETRPVALIDLDLPLGGIGPMLYMDGEQNILELLRGPQNHLSMNRINQVAQHRRTEMIVLTAPGVMMNTAYNQQMQEQLRRLLQILKENNYLVIIDGGSTLTPLVHTALQDSEMIFVVTSGKPVANRLHDEFVAAASQLGIEPHRMLPVVNELHGRIDSIQLARVPVARFPHASERSRSRLWLKDQGMRKLVGLLN